MCGVVGYWNRDGQVASEVLLERMLERIRHRGPDDKGTWTSGAVGLGHCRLSILDLSPRGHQPFLTADGQGVISYNGEVYNYRELRLELEKEGICFRSTTDTEAVLYALHQWGPERAVKLFNGMFAFVYFDLRSQTLWLARDRAGIKPLYLARIGNTIAFASEIKGLFGHPNVPCRPDMHALTTQLIYQRLDGGWTPFEKIESLIPGSLLKVTKDSEETKIYFDLLRDFDVERIDKGDRIPFEALTDQFENLFAASVKSHLVSDAPLAAMSSGGLDSSLMTALAKEYKSDIVAYIADVKGIQVPEVPKAQKVCRQLGVELRPVKVAQEEYLRLWPRAVYQNDQPNFFSQNIPFMAVAEAARRDGFKVLLTGEGSDELFGGYSWQVEAYHMWRLRRLHLKFLPNIPLLRILGRFASKIAPLDFESLSKRPFRHLSQGAPFENDIRPLCAVDGGQRPLREQRLFRKLASVKPLEERAFLARSFEDFYCHLRNILTSNDKMAMAHSIEARVPFLENQLMDFGHHLPCRAKYYKGMTKRIVKKAALKRLPHDIIHAKKIGFGVSSQVWTQTLGFLKGGMVAEFFKWGNQEAEEIRHLILSEDPIMIFHLLSIELWARIYFQGESCFELAEKLLAIQHSPVKSQSQARGVHAQS